MIDRIRHDIQERLDQLLAEADKLRHALVALDPRGHSASPSTKAKAKVAPTRPARTAATTTATKPVRAQAPPRRVNNASGSKPSRTPPGQTRAKVLAALSSEQALTATDVAKATGLPGQTVSTTLSRLAKSGDVTKADRGYRLPSINQAPPVTVASTIEDS